MFSVGGVTRSELSAGPPLPKAGIIAELEGARVAAAIAAELEVQAGEPPPPFDGHGHFMSRSTATLREGEFFAESEPVVKLRARWFGR